MFLYYATGTNLLPDLPVLKNFARKFFKPKNLTEPEYFLCSARFLLILLDIFQRSLFSKRPFVSSNRTDITNCTYRSFTISGSDNYCCWIGILCANGMIIYISCTEIPSLSIAQWKCISFIFCITVRCWTTCWIWCSKPSFHCICQCQIIFMTITGSLKRFSSATYRTKETIISVQCSCPYFLITIPIFRI